MIAQLDHRYFISMERRAVYEKVASGFVELVWRRGLKARDPVRSLPPDAQGLVCGVERAWEWAREEWHAPDECVCDPCEDVYEVRTPFVSTSSGEDVCWAGC